MAKNYNNPYINNFGLYYDNIRPTVYVYGDQVYTSFGAPILDVETDTLDKNDLKQRFNRGSLIKAKTMHVLISSSINPVETGSQALQMTSGSLNFASGSSDTFPWNRIAPPFVPNLHPYIKVFNFDAYTSLNQLRTPIGHPDSIEGDIVATNTTIWECNTGSLLTPKFDDDDFTFGAFELKSGEGAEQQNSLQTVVNTNVHSYVCAKDNQWWIKSRFKITDNSLGFFIGVSSIPSYTQSWIDSFGSTNSNRIGFIKLDPSSENINATVGSFPSMDLQAATTIANKEIHQIGIYWTGEKIEFYHSKCAEGDFDYLNGGLPQMSLITTVTENIPSESALRPIFYIQNNNVDTPKTATIEYFQAAIMSSSLSS